MKNKKGFTLVEILTVVIIIGILSSLALPQYRRVVERARATEAMSGLKNLYDSSERLAVDFGYDDYNALFNNPPTSDIGIGRLDMFQDSGAPMDKNGIFTTENFAYKFISGSRIAAKRRGGHYDGTYIIFSRDDQSRSCVGTTAACDVYDLPVATGVTCAF